MLQSAPSMCWASEWIHGCIANSSQRGPRASSIEATGPLPVFDDQPPQVLLEHLSQGIGDGVLHHGVAPLLEFRHVVPHAEPVDAVCGVKGWSPCGAGEVVMHASHGFQQRSRASPRHPPS